MKKITYFLMLPILLLMVKVELSAQMSEKALADPFAISGSIDTYFRVNLNSGNDPDDAAILAPATSFANLPGFSLGMVNLIGSYEKDRVGIVADLVIGPRGQDAVFGSTTNSNIINQMYIYYYITDKITLTWGNFNTFLGYEVISPTENFNYSTSYMFSYGPFSHIGFKADFEFESGLTFMGGIFNPTDFTEFNPNASYVGGAQAGYADDSFLFYLNGLFRDGFFQLDITTGISLDDVYLGLNGTAASDNFAGIAGYLQVATSDELTLGVRVEYFKDYGIDVLNYKENVVDFTLSANYKIGNLTIIPEVRLDKLSYKDFITDSSRPDEPRDLLVSFVLAAVYSF